MWKEHKWKLLISTALILLPILFGLLVWKELPETMTIHWGADGVPDGTSGRGFAVFGLPVILLAVHWLCVFVTSKDPGNREQNKKMFGLVLWITPVLSLAVNAVLYFVALEREMNTMLVVFLLMGVMFAALGNYLPKCRRNYTIGIKVRWTLNNEENWNATHRVGGKIWFFAGIILLVSAFLPQSVSIPGAVTVLVLAVVVPILYSYLYYRKQLREGRAEDQPLPMSKSVKVTAVTALIVLGVVLAAVGVLTLSGDMEVNYGEDAFTVEGTFWQNITVSYDAIDAVEFREQDDKGQRVFGYGSARLLAGSFRNGEFGDYTRYSYTKCDACVVVTAEGNVLVLSGPDAESTKAMYETILDRMGQKN